MSKGVRIKMYFKGGNDVDKLTTIKRILKFEVYKFPIWAWLVCFLLIILLRHQIANMLATLLPIALIVCGVFYFIGQRQNAIKVGIFIVYSIIISTIF